MITLENVTKFYDVKESRKYIFKNVSFSLPGGKNLGIIGRNGAGKSTFLRMLGGIDFPNSGRIESNMSFSWPIGLSGGFQGSLTGRENAKFVCRFYGKSSRDIKKSLEFIKEFSELGRYFDMPIKTYSSGMKSRLNFTLSLAFDFDCYLIDEVLSVGDKNFKKKSADALSDLRNKRNFLLVSHNMPSLRKMWDARVLLAHAELTYFEDIKEAVDAYPKTLN